MGTLFLRLGGISAFLSVALGAFGTHSLRQRLSQRDLEIFNTGVQYQALHALALIAVGILLALGWNSKNLRVSGWLFVAGTLIFSGSLYALAMSGVRALGAITPLGGVCFLTGWILFTVGAGSRSAS